MKRQTNARAIMVAVVAFVVCLVVSFAALRAWDASVEDGQRERTSYLAENQATKLQMSLEQYEHIAEVWSGSILAHDGEVEDFEAISQKLYEKNPTILAIQLAPDGVVTYTYPVNNDIIGYDILADESGEVEAVEARESGEPVVVGPTELVQGGEGIIIRYPIYLDDLASSSNEDGFWGFSTIVLDVPDVFSDVKLDRLTQEGYDYELVVSAADGSKTTVLAEGDGPADPEVASFELGQRTWTLSLSPTDGWATDGIHASHVTLGLVASAVVACAAALLARLVERDRELKETKSDLVVQAKALAASERANRMQSKALDASRKANEMQLEALEASKRANRAQVEALEVARRETRQKTAELEASQEANRAKTEFISRISHDIRTPIGAIKNLTEFAMQDMDDKEKLTQDLERIDTSNRFLLSLINDVLDISRVDSGKIELKSEPYPFEDYEADIRNILAPMCEEKGLRYEYVNARTTEGTVVADKVRLNQITLNLLSNAVKYTPPGGTVRFVDMSEDAADGKVRLRFRVEDTGIGMSEEFQQRMFEDFSQEYDNPLRPQGTTGTGLGLSICRKMLDLMGGTIEVSSAQGEGTVASVAIDLPDARADESYAEALEAAGSDEAGQAPLSGRILVVEDNAINLQIALRIFEGFGLEVQSVENGYEAVERFKASAPGDIDAILMDIQMPVMNGYDATAAIRALDRDDARTVPIIAMTADAFDEAVRRAYEVGMDEYVTKPLDAAYLREVLTKVGL